MRSCRLLRVVVVSDDVPPRTGGAPGRGAAVRRMDLGRSATARRPRVVRGGPVLVRPVRMGAAIGDRVAEGAAAAWKEL
ncbi:hypothetical protein GCM10010519_61230 [Streptomyces lactacystinicus]